MSEQAAGSFGAGSSGAACVARAMKGVGEVRA